MFLLVIFLKDFFYTSKKNSVQKKLVRILLQLKNPR